MKNIFVVLNLFAPILSVNGQTDSTALPFKVTGYLEVYYCYDFAKPENHNRPGFIYSHNRHNEFNLNLGHVKISYEKSTTRANFGLMVGTYSNANLSSEPGVLKNIFEANAGVNLSKSKNIWIDAGIFPSHIGFESAIGKDCWNLTRSILAENSPYYESGIRLSHTSRNEKWFIACLLLNGWQHIQRINGNNSPAFGHQLNFKPNSKVVLNSSSFIGNDKPDSIIRMRYFHNFYSQFQLHKKFQVIIGLDFGAEQKMKHKNEYNVWYSPVFIVRYSLKQKWNIAVRGEYYSDKHQVIIATGTPNGFQTYGYSMNLDYSITQNIMWRIEGRGFKSKDAIFTQKNNISRQNWFITTSLAILIK
jgi:hypothetical protein